MAWTIVKTLTLLQLAAPVAAASGFRLSWYTIDGGGPTNDSAGGAFALQGTCGQPDAGVMTSARFGLIGGFWGLSAGAGQGIPEARVTAAVSRKINLAGPGGTCDLPLFPALKTEPRLGGITEVRIGFDIPPGGPADAIPLDEKTCPAPGTYSPYTGTSARSAFIEAGQLVVRFAPGLENGRTYRIRVGPEITSVPGQFVEVRVLAGDVDSSGRVNAVDRSVVVGAWTNPSGFTCPTDVDSSGATNAVDRSIVVGAWTSAENCAP